jgi:hypothetical protein
MTAEQRKMTAEQKTRQLIDRVYGNLAIENPTVTREFVAEQVRLYREAEANCANGKKP